MIKPSFWINERPLPIHSWHEDVPYFWSGGMLGLEIILYNGFIYINFLAYLPKSNTSIIICLSFTMFSSIITYKCKRSLIHHFWCVIAFSVHFGMFLRFLVFFHLLFSVGSMNTCTCKKTMSNDELWVLV